tara:strand:+ start:297 stop:413 length:117 start_codon:yes stop_codon:yes gene_type:complete
MDGQDAEYHEALIGHPEKPPKGHAPVPIGHCKGDPADV